MKYEIERKIEKLIEEANQAVGDSVSKYRPISDTLTMVPGISALGQMGQGYQVGKDLNHKVAGTLLGAEAAAGAKSKYDDSVGIGDVYTGKNMAKRAGQGAVLGGLAGGIGSGVNNFAVGEMVPEGVDPEEFRAAVSQSIEDTPGMSADLASMSLDDPASYAALLAGTGAAGSALVGPGLKYGLGKLFGKNKGK